MNKITIIGRLTRDPELKTANSGTEYCKFSVAVDRRKQKDKEQVTDFFDATAWGKSGVFVNQYFKKGDGIIMEGRMESDRYTDKDGKNRVSWGVTVEQIEFPPSRKSDSASGGSGTFQDLPDSEEGLPF